MGSCSTQAQQLWPQTRPFGGTCNAVPGWNGWVLESCGAAAAADP